MFLERCPIFSEPRSEVLAGARPGLLTRPNLGPSSFIHPSSACPISFYTVAVQDMPSAVSKQTKKRSAPAQSGPKSKKPHLEVAAEPQTKKRSRPVTAAVQESEDESSDGESVDEFPESDVLVDEVEDVGDEMDTAAPKDPNGTFATQPIHLPPKRSSA